jgi:hypothetical protein
MGNGATFAIETLVFAAAAYAAEKHTFGCWMRDITSVYGDDIIVPQLSAPYLITILEALGFSLNREKSFINGPVRESCGADWFQGTDVRPVFLKKQVNEVADLYYLRNAVYRWFARRWLETPHLDELIKRYIPQRDLYYGPLSDHEFDKWWHTPDNSFGRYQNWGYVINCLGIRPARRRGRTKLAFRKLMARLPKGTVPNTYYRVGGASLPCLEPRPVDELYASAFEDQIHSTNAYVLHIAAGGSVFDLIEPRLTYVPAKRRLPMWQTAYSPRVLASAS